MSLHCHLFHTTKNTLPIINSGLMTRRFLNLQEYHSKNIMKEAGINVQQFRMANSAQEAADLVKDFKVREYVIKAQILAGGRGKGVFSNGFEGGVKLTKNSNEVSLLVGKMVGHRLKTKQTSADGVLVQKVMVAEALDIERETYLAFLVDRDRNGPVMVGSPMGGMDIEEVAEKNPQAILTIPIDINEGLTTAAADKMAKFLNFEQGPKHTEASKQISRLYKMFAQLDCTQIEVNPFGETPDGRVVCFDAKLNFDDNAAFRQKAVYALDDTSESDPREVQAAQYDLNYIGMDGNIGCMVNGAGLAMATMDIVQHEGGTPANFFDLGGKIKEDNVTRAFEILCSDAQVKCILVNIFGGIVDCALVARGIIAACKTLKMTVPLVVRLEGNNVQKAKELLNSSKLDIIAADDLGDAAKKAVGALKK